MDSTQYKTDNSCKILIVDDDADDHYFLRTALREVLPHAVIESLYDGSEALEYLETCTSLPHLIFMDLNMSRTGGKKATQLIRSNHKLDNVPVIILTTSDGRGTEKQELIRLGANAFYTKPMNLTELIDIVQTVRQNWLNILFDHNALA